MIKLAFAFCLTLASCVFGEVVRGVVVSVHDGDTLPPSPRLRRTRLEPFGKESRDALERLVGGREVTADVVGHDRYRRSIAVVHCGSTCANEAQVAVGLSWWYARYARKDGRLKVLEAEARRARAGLWSEDGAVAPWEWRRRAATAVHRSQMVSSWVASSAPERTYSQ